MNSGSLGGSFYYNSARDRYVSSNHVDESESDLEAELDQEVEESDDEVCSQDIHSIRGPGLGSGLGSGSHTPGPFIGCITTHHHGSGMVSEDTKGLLDSFDVSVQLPPIAPHRDSATWMSMSTLVNNRVTDGYAGPDGQDEHSINFERNDLYRVTSDLQDMITSFRENQAAIEAQAPTDSTAPPTNHLLTSISKAERPMLDQVCVYVCVGVYMYICRGVEVDIGPGMCACVLLCIQYIPLHYTYHPHAYIVH